METANKRTIKATFSWLSAHNWSYIEGNSLKLL